MKDDALTELFLSISHMKIPFIDSRMRTYLICLYIKKEEEEIAVFHEL